MTDPIDCDDFRLFYPAFMIFVSGEPIWYDMRGVEYFALFTDLDLVAQWIEKKKLVDAVAVRIVSREALLDGLEFIRQRMPSARLAIDPCEHGKRKSLYLVIGDYLDRLGRTSDAGRAAS